MNSYLSGVLVGDGCKYLAKNGAFSVWIDQHNRNLKILEKTKKILEKDGYKTYYYKIPDNKQRVLTYSKKLYLEFENIRKNLIEYFEKLPKKEKMKFIAGFFDAEGTVTDRLVIYNSNRKLLESLKKFLEKLGIICYIYRFGKIFGLQI